MRHNDHPLVKDLVLLNWQCKCRTVRQCFCMKKAQALQHPVVCRDQCIHHTCWCRLRACKRHFRFADRSCRPCRGMAAMPASVVPALSNCQGHHSLQLQLAENLLFPGSCLMLCWKVISRVHNLDSWMLVVHHKSGVDLELKYTFGRQCAYAFNLITHVSDVQKANRPCLHHSSPHQSANLTCETLSVMLLVIVAAASVSCRIT